MTAQKIRVACVQMTSGPDIQKNLDDVSTQIRRAAENSACFIATPEMTDRMVPAAERLASAQDESSHPALPVFSELAIETGAWLLLGSIGVKEGDKVQNRSYLFAPDGKVVAKYNKIHMFDVNLPSGETYRESNTFAAGDQAVLAETSFGKVGMTVCYDMRFPHLYRQLAIRGAKVLTVPSAFTVPTGLAHWHILLRARAIENGAFVMAPAQVGDHNGIRETFGHSLIVGPWGEILAESDQPGPDVITADLDFGTLNNARQSVPSLRHSRVVR